MFNSSRGGGVDNGFEGVDDGLLTPEARGGRSPSQPNVPPGGYLPIPNSPSKPVDSKPVSSRGISNIICICCKKAYPSHVFYN